MTCARCLSGRHFGCRGCGCSVCTAPVARRARAPGPRKARPPKAPTQTAVLGYRTRLGLEDVPVVEFYLGCGLSLSETARRMNISRDQVRTVARHAA